MLKKLSSSAIDALQSIPISKKNVKIGMSTAVTSALLKCLLISRSPSLSSPAASSLKTSPALEAFHLLLAKKLIANGSDQAQKLFSVPLLDLSNPGTISLLNSFLKVRTTTRSKATTTRSATILV
ncbi:hypothetical protein TL16_g07076 [Triparma laevis f. inornata]|uniref:Uncharacterized protein n=1 Tax=Triparma laevis f. inornata TaxID=1714386 RepID=A0A9W7ECM5_9STRA|nr:hypothetical protein TL16_g07076 [Triparma laevis f. inornata]